MTKRKQKPLGPAWLADWVVALGSWKLASLIGAGYWLWRHWRGVGAVLLAALVFVQTGSLAVAAAALVVVFAASRWRPAKRAARWWDEATLAGAMADAGILTRRGDALPTLSRRGKPVTDDHGTTVVVNLPGGTTLAMVLARRSSLASALMVPDNRLTITQEPDDNANVVRLHVGTPVKKSTTPPVASAESTDWTQPVVLGADDRGHKVTFTTTQTHSVLAGATGSGKSALAKLIVAHAALDPRVRLYFIDGKGDSGPKGWQPLEPCCEAFVRGMGPDSPARIEALLNEVYDLSEQRGAAGDEAPEIVLILEEWAAARSVLARLDRKAAERCDGLVTVLLATARSRGVHVILIAQRGTASSFPTDQRANCGQRLVGKFGDRAEAGYVLESLPARLPERAGEFAVSLDGKAPALVTVDYLTDLDWRKVCRRAAGLRTPARPALTLAPSPAGVTDAPGKGLADGTSLRAAALDVLVAGDLRGMPATELLDALPDSVRQECPTPQRLGFALRRWPDLFERAHIDSRRGWRATAAARVGGVSAGYAGFQSASPCERAESVPDPAPQGFDEATVGFEDAGWETYGGPDDPEDDPA